MEVGRSASIEIKVEPDMFAQFEGRVVHEAYSTVSMVYHMEWASRQIILPYLEDHEEGIGGSVEVKHIAPSAAGTKVKVTAVLTEIRGNKIITETEARNEAGVIGAGKVIQVIMPKAKIGEKLAQSAEADKRL